MCVCHTILSAYQRAIKLFIRQLAIQSPPTRNIEADCFLVSSLEYFSIFCLQKHNLNISSNVYNVKSFLAHGSI